MKIIVQSNSTEHGLVNDDNKYLPPHRPCVALHTNFLSQRIAKGDFRVLVGNLEDGATDDEFQKYLAEAKGDTQYAIDAFEAAYSSEVSRRNGDFEQTRKDRAALLADEQKRAQAERDAEAADKEAKRLQAEKDTAAANAENERRAQEQRDQAQRDQEAADADKAAKEEKAAKEAAATNEQPSGDSGSMTSGSEKPATAAAKKK